MNQGLLSGQLQSRLGNLCEGKRRELEQSFFREEALKRKSVI